MIVTLYKLNNMKSVSWWKIEPLEDGTGFKTSWGNNHLTPHAGLNTSIDVDPSPRCLEDRILSAIRKKIAREGYSTEVPTEKPQLPMLAHKWQDYADKAAKWPYLCVQPKLDGHRCIATPLRQYSRKNDPFSSIPHIALIFNELTSDPFFCNIRLDAELYIPGSDLETTQSAIRRTGPHPFFWSLVQLHIFDVVDTETPFHRRRTALQAIYSRLVEAWEDTTAKKYSSDLQKYVMDECPIKLVPTWNAFPEELPAYFKDYVSQGYEGLIIRNPNSLYHLNKRTSDLLKYKDRLDSEFEIVGVVEKKNLQGVFKCRLPNGGTTEITPAGSASYKRRIVQYPQNYIGKWVTVKYEKMSRDGSLLKATAHEVHDRQDKE